MEAAPRAHGRVPRGLSPMELWAPRTSPVGSLCPLGTQGPGSHWEKPIPSGNSQLGLEKNHG